MDFLLSLTPQAREKLSTTSSTNKSVMYMDQILGEDDVSPILYCTFMHLLTQKVEMGDRDEKVNRRLFAAGLRWAVLLSNG